VNKKANLFFQKSKSLLKYREIISQATITESVILNNAMSKIKRRKNEKHVNILVSLILTIVII